MVFGRFGPRILTAVGVVLALLVLTLPAFAQVGRVTGRVIDEEGKPVEGATITVVRQPDTTGQKWEATSDRNGTYAVAGMTVSGQYQVTAQKQGVGTDSYRAPVKIGVATTVNFTLSTRAAAAAAAAETIAAVKKEFEAGVAASQAGDHQTAIARFTEATVTLPTCADCFFNIGVEQMALKNYEAAEAAYKKAIELRAEYPEAYNALAGVYTAQRKMELAAEAAAKAAELSASTVGGGSAEDMYNSGVVMWNAGKTAEAKAQFEAALKANPQHALAHYQMGMVLLNEGKMPEAVAEFETYLKIDPNGANVAQAKALVAQLKK